MLSGYIFILLTFTGAAALKICSFNIRSFGENKIAKPENLDVIVKIISRCDLMLLMEIKDVRNKAFPELMKQLNSQFKGKKDEYNHIISERLGRKTYKEQYAFIYRQSVVSVKEIYQYPDQQTGDEDVFSREPFVVWFDSPKTAVKEFIIIPLHTTPETSVREIDELYDVYLNVKQRWSSEQNFIFMGDFNADCGYVPKKDWKNIRLRSDTSFVWLIDDNMDTSVKETTNCAYDRIVVHGEAINKAIDLESLEIFNFKAAFGLTEEEALAVSDHFPVAVELRKARGFITWFKSLRDKVLKTK
ncbi:deoxyribonuclease gamma-like isoform X1 [Polypterus senegalus]|uniref:deoxyribonuclease gamma-like isoform X1 n=1 Tax=Polypterus senegalus TaxID=55291 RepID=UPI0019658C99|nr:deoxyribonuclease gamma-like isoform X1 [Polypterus senegalus]